MNICVKHSADIAFEGHDCPACDLQDKLDDLESEVSNLKDEMIDLRQENSELESQLEDLK